METLTDRVGKLTQHTGWLLDLFACPRQGAVLWLLGEDGLRRRFYQPFPIVFYAAGPPERLRALWRFLQEQPVPVTLARSERRDLFNAQPVTVLAVQVEQFGAQTRLFQQVSQEFPDLSYYDADVPLTLRYAAVHNVFPLSYCRIRAAEDGLIQDITPLDTPWELDPPPAPLRLLSIEPDSDPHHRQPAALHLSCERYEYRLTLEPVRPLLVGLGAILRRHDPDVLLTSWGDTWLLPRLLELSSQAGIDLPLNREPGRAPEHKREHTYFSYGQVIYRGEQTLLFGRWHVDRFNAMLFHDYGLDGVLELARVTALPVQTAARVSPGSGISAMQILTALRLGVLVPWHKQQAERPKTALDLVNADQGGLVYQPTVGLHRDVAEIDFVSMYPGIMVRFNISPETVGSSAAIASSAQQLEWFDPALAPSALPEGEESAQDDPAKSDFLPSPQPLSPSGRGVNSLSQPVAEQPAERGGAGEGQPAQPPQLPEGERGDGRSWNVTEVKVGHPLQPPRPADEQGGLVPQTLSPLLEKRLALKARLAGMPSWHPDYRAYQARTSAHKWLLVTCFGYLGYKNARFGRIEAHEAVTAYGREALLRAKEAAEDLGFQVLHLYVDGMWVRRPGAAAPSDFQPLLNEILERTGLPISLDGVYRWVAFLPSRVDARVPVANRYFGAFQDGSLKVRGIEARRRDTPVFVAQAQMEILEVLARAPEGPPLRAILALLRRKLAALRAGRVPLEDLLVSQKLSRELGEYRARSPVARAVAQLESAGKRASPGQRIRFLYMRGEPGVHAWDLPQRPHPSGVDVARYSELLARAAAAVLWPFGVEEARLRQWLFGNAAYAAPPGELPGPARANSQPDLLCNLLPEPAYMG